MNLEELKKRKKELGFTNEDLADVSGVPIGTVQRIMSGATKNPRCETLEALERALDTGDSYVHEAMHSYETEQQHQGNDHGKDKGNDHEKSHEIIHGRRTPEDFYSLPDDVKAELIDGEICRMTASPKVFHRLVAFEIASQIHEHIRKCGNGAFVLQDICVRLARDGSDVVRPDVALVFDPGQLAERCVIGAPDFVAEVVSPLTRKRIMTSKVKKYLVAGVKIYWIIDLKKRQIIVYDFTDDEFSPVIRELKGKLRLDLSGCECDIELDHISELVAKNRRYV